MDFITALKGGANLGSSFADNLMKATGFIPNLASKDIGLKAAKSPFTNFTDWLFKSYDANKITHFDRLGNILGSLGALGIYNQQKVAQNNFDLQKDAYNFNKFLANEELNRRKNMENKLQNVWSN